MALVIDGKVEIVRNNYYLVFTDGSKRSITLTDVLLWDIRELLLEVLEEMEKINDK